jgi:hypothetical protein
MGHWWSDTDRGNRCTRRKDCPRSTLSTTNPTQTGLLVLNQRRCGEGPATNRLNHDMACQTAEKIAMDRSQVHGNDLVQRHMETDSKLQNVKIKRILPIREVPGTNLCQKTGCRGVFRDFLSTSRQMAGKVLKSGYCRFLLCPFLFTVG